MLEAARRSGTGVVLSPLDSYVTGRLVSLSVPVREVMSRDPLVAEPDDLLADIADRIKDVHYSAAITVDEHGAPVGIVTRAELVNPVPRQVLLVDHAEQAQSVPGVEQAQIVEILDHHHIGSIETRFPVAATFDPVGSTATLVVERFRSHGREPQRPTATMLLAAVLSDTVILSSPTTTERDHQVVAYLEELLRRGRPGVRHRDVRGLLGRGRRAGVRHHPARRQGVRGAATAGACASPRSRPSGKRLLSRRPELLEAMEGVRERQDYVLYALMITDIVEKGTELLVAGDATPVERAFGVDADGGVLDLPGVMSRKKQVAPKLLAAF